MGLALGMALKFYISVEKELKVKVIKILGLIPTFVEVNQFLFKMFKIIRFLRSPKCLKTIVELMLTTQKANACRLLDWLFCSVVPSLGKFGPKTQNCQFKLRFGT